LSRESKSLRCRIFTAARPQFPVHQVQEISA
jgi:hypothetical protein